MIGIAIDAAVLILLIKSISDDDVSWGFPVLISIVAAIAVSVLAMWLVPMMGLLGLIIAANIVGLLVGLAVSALYGTEIKRSFMVGGIFVLVHLSVAFLFIWLLH
jgi:hypothetical protein